MFHEDFKSANSNNVAVLGSQCLEVIKWVPSKLGSFKLNTNAAIDLRSRRVGIGVIIRDSAGCVLASSAQVVNTKLSLVLAKVLSVLRGMRFARETGLWPCLVETDAQVEVKLVNFNTILLSDVGIYIRDIHSLFDVLNSCPGQFVPRKANMASHSLAKFGLSCVSNCFWMEDYPPGVVHVVLGNCPLSL